MTKMDLTQFVFDDKGRLRDKKDRGHLMNGLGSWHPGIYQFSEKLRAYGIDDITQGRKDEMATKPSLRDNPGNRKAVERVIANWESRKAPGYTLTREPMEHLAEMLHLPLVGHKIKHPLAGDFRHLALFQLVNKMSDGHFYTRAWLQTPGRNNSCSLNTFAEFLATMKMTSLEALRAHIIQQLGGTREVARIAQAMVTLKADKQALAAMTAEIASLETGLAKQKEGMTAVAQMFGKQLKEMRQNLKTMPDSDEKHNLQKEYDTLHAQYAQILEKQFGASPEEQALEEKKAAYQELKTAYEEKKRLIMGKQELLAGLAAVKEGIAAGHEDLLSLHLAKLDEALPADPQPGRESIRQELVDTAKQLHGVCDDLKHKRRPGIKKPGRLTREKEKATPPLRDRAVAFMKKVLTKIPPHRFNTPKSERMRLLIMKVDGPYHLDDTELRTHVLAFMQTAAISRRVVDAYPDPDTAPPIERIISTLPLERKQTSSGKACLQELIRGDDDLATLCFGDAGAPPNYQDFYEGLKQAAISTLADGAEAGPHPANPAA